jgi:hypothetical protein
MQETAHRESKQEEEGTDQAPHDGEQLGGGQLALEDLLGGEREEEEHRGVEHGALGSSRLRSSWNTKNTGDSVPFDAVHRHCCVTARFSKLSERSHLSSTFLEIQIE